LLYGCGNIYHDQVKSLVTFRVTKFSHLLDIVIPFFVKYPIQGSKQRDYLDFCIIADILKNRNEANLEVSGSLSELESSKIGMYAQIRLIKSGMNKGRN
jgi:hypothetical protein